MTWLRRLLGLVVMILSLAVFVGCVAGIVGAWKARREATSRVDAVAEQLDGGFQRISGASGNLHQSVETIRADVKLVQDDRSNLDPGEERNRLVTVYFRTVVQRFRLLSEAVSGVTRTLKTLPESPLGQASRIDAEKVDRAAKQAAELSNTVEKLQSILGADGKMVSEAEVVEVADEIERGLAKCDALMGDYERDLESARAAIPERKAEVHRWLDLATTVVTVVGAWFAFSQVCLFLRGWKWCVGSTNCPTPTAARIDR